MPLLADASGNLCSSVPRGSEGSRNGSLGGVPWVSLDGGKQIEPEIKQCLLLFQGFQRLQRTSEEEGQERDRESAERDRTPMLSDCPEDVAECCTVQRPEDEKP